MTLDELFNQVPQDLQLLHEDHATNFGTFEEPDFNPRYSKVVGTMDGKEIWASRYIPEHHIFAFRNGDETEAFIIIKDHQINNAYPLTRIWSRGGKETAGLITALLLYLIRKLQFKIVIPYDEPLTPHGWNWLIKAIQRGNFKAFDANTHQQLSIDQLIYDKNLPSSTSTLSVVLEGALYNQPIFGTGYRQLSEMWLVRGNKELL